jgi:hypothetical protein
MAISVNLTYLGKECVKIQYASTILQNHIIGLKTKGNSMETLELLSCTTWTFLVQNQDDDDHVVLELPC